MVTTHIIKTWEQFRLLEEEWDKLLIQTSADSIFLRWNWMEAWRQAIDERISPYIILLYNDDKKLVAFAPFYIGQYRFMKFMPYGVLRFMADFPTGAEYPDIVIDPAYEEIAIEEIAKTLMKSKCWDAMWIPRIAGWTGALKRFRSLSSSMKTKMNQRDLDFSHLALPTSFDEYLTKISSSHRSQIKRQSKKILADANVDVLLCESEKQLPYFIEELLKLHAKRWEDLGELGTFNKRPVEARFYHYFLPYALKLKWLRMYLLELDDRAKAIQVGYQYNKIYHQLQEGFDTDSYPGIGNFLRQESLKLMINEGLTEYDFLGGYTEHKRRWGAVKRTGYELFAIRKSVKTLPLLIRSFWPTSRFFDEVTHTKIANKLTT